MSLPGVCPECSAKFPLHLALQDACARKALLAALQVQPSLAGGMIAYMNLFAPAKRAIRMDKLARLLNELAVQMKEASVQIEGRTWPAPTDYWSQAFDIVSSKSDLELPLSSHRYLFKVIQGIANKAGAIQENQKEKAIRNGQHRQSSTIKKPPQKIDENKAFQAHIDRLKAAGAKIGETDERTK